MKNTTKKILLWLYSADESQNRRVSSENLRLLLPEIKQSGYRSLLNLLKKQQMIVVDDRVNLSSHGRSALEAQFPALKAWSFSLPIEWSQIVFIEAPESDVQFRYLRQHLLNNRCGQVARGVYYYPGKLPELVSNTLQKLYAGRVVVTGLKSWQFGDERLLITKIFQLLDLKAGYSGISKEVYSLLSKFNKQKSIEDKDKMVIAMVFDRLVEFLNIDLGLLQLYYPDSKSGLDLLVQLQGLIED